MQSYLNDVGGKPQCSIIGLGTRTSSVNAALVNGTLGHALDYDDFAFPALGHPTTCVLPAVMALGESTGAKGEDLLLSFVVGFEAFMKIGGVVSPSHWYKGFHATGTVGTYGAVAAAGKLLDLDEAHMINAFGVAGSEASGLKQNFGTMAKPFHAGHAAEGGVKAALLARNGFVAAKDVLEGMFGFAKVLADTQNFDYLDRLGDPWDILDPGPFFKLSPSCGGTQAGMNALFSLIEEYDIKPDEVERIDAGTNPGGPEQLIYAEPKTALQAKFSMQFCLAILLLERKAGLSQFTDAKVREPKVVELMKRITLYVDPELTKSVPLEWVDKTTTVKVKLKDGREYKRTADLRRLTWDELTSKYEECAGRVLSESKVRQSIDLLTNLEKLDDVKSLMELIRIGNSSKGK
jgi:2-methylcitrate dehydratase PrpD